jgi:hypothetical protein
MSALEADESLRATARATDAIIAVSDRRVIVAARERIALSVSIESLRRIQFDIEKRRPATLVIVPEAPADEPQVLAIPPEEIRGITSALALIAEGLAAYSKDHRA